MRIFLIGPGGAGKSTRGKILAERIGYRFIDLDIEFCDKIENIGDYILTKGYKKYCFENSKLFYELLNKNTKDVIFSLSSGFLVHKNLDELTSRHKQTLKNSGTSILFLPSTSLNKSTKIILERQLSRGFGLKENREKIKFIRRFKLYKELGDIKIFSHEKPQVIVEKIVKQLNLSKT